MIIIKGIILILVLGVASAIGVMFSKKYKDRVEELKDFKTALNIFKTKIKYTYEPIPDIFLELSKNFKSNISNVFNIASKNMNTNSAGEAWILALDTTFLNITKEDKEILKNMSKLLGKTDMEGQVNEIELTETFLNSQIEKAEQEKAKNEKLYKTLGYVTGLGLVIILI